MWRVRVETINATTQRRSLVDSQDCPMSFSGVLAGWSADAAFRRSWIANLRAVAFDAYAWECPPVTAANASRPFECVFVASPELATLSAEPRAFAEHFSPGCQVVTFDNLCADAKLVAPCPGDPKSDYRHLARFVATAPDEQQDALWQAVGAAMKIRLGGKPVWLSTAGLGVGWLHVRLDDRPKYYRHVPYVREEARA
jgi:hypothetical protein